ncbi:MAG: AAA family ATPase [bacterium]|nr:AAA family ATPase [bacterium]
MEAIRLQRFRGFLDSGWIELKPITLLFGYNSSGKSSILQALLMMKQSLENPSREIPLVFSSKRTDLGTYYDIVYNHAIDPDNPIILSLRVNINNKIEDLAPFQDYQDSLFQELKRNPIIELSVSINYNEDKKFNEITGFTLCNVNGKNILSMHKKQNATKHFYSDYLQTWTKELDWEHFLPAINEFEDHRLIHQIFAYLRGSVSRVFHRLTHIGPVRAVPERIQQFTGERPFNVGVRGEDALKLLYLSKHDNTFSVPLENNINAWLAKYNYTFKWKMLDENIGQFILTDSRNNLKVNLKDVGFGISQVLPIVIQVYTATSDSIVLIEQPEIHLHSRAQSELADLLLQAIYAQEEGFLRLIVETHSENLLLRLRRRLAENYVSKNTVNKIKVNDIVIYFVENVDGQSIIHGIGITEHGEFEEPIPKGFKKFFTDDFEEVMKINLALATSKNK